MPDHRVTATPALHRQASQSVSESRALFVCLLLLILAPGTAPATECRWLAISAVDSAFPELAPWRVTVGGEVGRCQFMSRPDRPPNMFGANQMVHDSAPAAAEFVQGLRPEMAQSYEIVDAPALGERGFVYVPPAGAGQADGRMVGYVGHRGRVAALATLSLQQPVSTELREAGAELVRAALAVADDEQALAAAADCPWLDAALLQRLLPAGEVSQQVLGENSCLATDAAGAAITVSIMEASPALMQRRGAGCTWEEMSALGEGAVLGHSCTEGRPRASLRVVVGDSLVDYSLVLGDEPTPAQREALVDLGTWVQAHRR